MLKTILSGGGTLISNCPEYITSSSAKIIVRDSKIVTANTEFTELTGYSLKDVKNVEIKFFFEKRLRSNYSFSTDIPFQAKEFMIFTKSLEYREVAIQQIDGEKKNEFIVLLREKPYSRLENKMMCVNKTLEENIIGVGIYRVPGYILVKANSQYLGFLGSPFDYADSAYGKPLSEIISDWYTSRAKNAFDEIVRTDKSVYLIEHPGLLLNDYSRYWDNSLTPVSEDGCVKFIVSQFNDVTSRVMNREHISRYTRQTEQIHRENQIKIQQEQLLNAEIEKREFLEDALRIKDEFLYIISHEFKTPLAVISSAIQTMELVYRDQITAKLGKYLSIIKQNTNRQLRLVNNLLDITRVNSGFTKVKRKNIDVVALTNAIIDSVELYAMQKHIRMDFDCSFGKKNVLLDEEKFERIMLNLLSNAIKFTPNGKSIKVSITCTKRSRKDMLCVSVKDEGIGIPKDKQDYIFERFGQADTTLTRQAEGTGIGLYLVKLLAEAQDGKVDLESKVGLGSTFRVLLPIDKGCTENGNEVEQTILADPGCNRLIQAAAVEFSDIYF